MNKLMLTLASLVLVLGLSACQPEGNKDNASENATEQSAAPAADENATPDSMKMDDEKQNGSNTEAAPAPEAQPSDSSTAPATDSSAPATDSSSSESAPATDNNASE